MRFWTAAGPFVKTCIVFLILVWIGWMVYFALIGNVSALLTWLAALTVVAIITIVVWGIYLFFED